jgi:hypothetical protein
MTGSVSAGFTSPVLKSLRISANACIASFWSSDVTRAAIGSLLSGSFGSDMRGNTPIISA